MVFQEICLFSMARIGSMANTNENIVWLSTHFEVVSNGVQELAANATEAQKTTHKDSKKKACKALLFLHQSVRKTSYN